MYSDNIVTINIKQSLTKHTKDNLYISRYNVFGLTAYGKTPKESSDNCDKLMNRFVNTYKEYNKLEDVLNRAKVEWNYT